MTSQHLDWQKNIFTVIDNYFQTIPNYISRNQLDSYNIFLKTQIPKTIRQFNPLVHMYGKHSYTNQSYESEEYYKHKIEIIIGGSLDEEGRVHNDGTGIYLTRPVIQENIHDPLHINVDVEDGGDGDDGDDTVITEKKLVRVRQLYPNEARLKNLTYSTLIACDIFVKITTIEIETTMVGDLQMGTPKEYVGDVQVYRQVPLGHIPIMIKSNLCVLSDTPKDIIYQMGECIYDQGGYFIINGKEKVIISQERQVENRMYVHTNNKDPKIDYVLDIRSVPENIMQPARITKLLLTTDNIIYVQIPHCNAQDDIPLILLFRALGIVTDKRIVEMIVPNNGSNLSTSIMNILYNSITDINKDKEIYTQQEAIEELSTYVTAWGKPVQNMYMKKVILQDILRNYFLPHVGKGFLDKAYFLAHMVKELLLVKLEVKTVTDRDNFMNKRVDAAGYLIGTIFRDLYFRVKNNFRDKLNIAYASVGETIEDADREWEKSIGNHRTQLDTLIGDIHSVTSTIKINEIFEQHIMNEGFMYAFKNCWGLKNARGCKQGIVQDLNRLSYLGFSSHLRRINTPLPSGAKVRAPHSLNASSYGIMCPCETPDGGNIGIRKNLAIMSQVTFGTHSDSLYRLLFSLDVVSIYDIDNRNIHTYTKVFLNEILIGFHEYPKYLCDTVRLYRRNALINVYTSISWYVMDNKINISTTSGRCCRPLLIVKQNMCTLTDDHIDQLKQGKINWKHLIGGFRTLDYVSPREDKEPYIDDNGMLIEFDKTEYKKTKSTGLSERKSLELYEGVIEYIDTEEANNTLIALTPHDLQKGSLNRYTHCEIHPTMLFGIIANNIPLLERNQAPRNQFATVHGKQALGVYATNFKNRMDTKVQVILYPQKPIVQSVYSKYLFTDKIPHGINAIVAVCCYTGYNQEDSLIFNKSSIERGLFRTVKFRTYSDMEDISSGSKEREEICFPDETCTIGMKLGNYSKLDRKTGFIKENSHVTDSDIIVGKVQKTGDKDIDGRDIYMDKSLIVKRHEGGIIDKVHYNKGNDDQNYVKIRLRKDKIPEIGDKFCSRFGQKGTVGIVLDSENMPFTKNGIVPDIIMNPHALPSRMTLGQILEVIMGKASVENGKIAKLASFSNINEPLIGDVLEKLGYERHANEVLYNGIDGKQMKVSIFMGPTYYQRLIHQVSDKMNSRTTGPKTSLTHQSVGGRSIGGGLRIGEMERDSLLAHGMSYFIKESFMERADKYSFYISNKSGLMAIVNKDKHIFEDFSKDETKIKINKEGNIEKFSNQCSSADFICIEAPYAFKLFLQEIESMGVALRMVTSDIYHRWSAISKGQIKVISSPFETVHADEDVEIISASPNTVSKNDIDNGADILPYYQTVSNTLTKPLNKYHNKIKEILLNNKTNNLCNISMVNKSLLDTSVGRGGDVWKWYRYNYKHILAIDVDKIGIESTEEDIGGLGARGRIESMKMNYDSKDSINIRKWAKHAKIFFGVADTSKNIRDITNIDESYVSSVADAYRYFPMNSFDVVSCQFTIHYYFKDKESIKGYLTNVQENIQENGYLLVTCLDGESVFNMLKKEHTRSGRAITEGYIESPPTQKNKIWSIRSDELDMTQDVLPNQTFNQSIEVFYQSIGNVRKEYLVHKEHLIRLAAEHNLFLPSDTEIQSNFNTISHSSELFKNIYKSISHKHRQVKQLGHRKNRGLKTYSDLHRYFIFKYMPDVTDEQRTLLTSRSLELLSNRVDVSISDYIIKHTFLPSKIIQTFKDMDHKKELEEQYRCNIIIHTPQEDKINGLLYQEKELRNIEDSSVSITRTSKGKLNATRLAENLAEQEKYEESLSIHEKLLDMLKIDVGPSHKTVIESMESQYKIYMKMNQYDKSETILQDILQVLDQLLQSSPPMSHVQIQKDIIIYNSDLAYCLYKLDRDDESLKLFEYVQKQLHSIFTRNEVELYSIQINYAEYLYHSHDQFIIGYNSYINIIGTISKFIKNTTEKEILFKKIFDVLYPEHISSIIQDGMSYTKISIISKYNTIENICIDLSRFRDKLWVQPEFRSTRPFGIIIPYYDEDGEIEDIVDSESSAIEIIEGQITEDTSTSQQGGKLHIKSDSHISKLLEDIQTLYSRDIDNNTCTIYLVKQSRKKINIVESHFTEDMVYDIDESGKEGYVKYNKGALINTGYSLAKRDNKDYIIILNSNISYSPDTSAVLDKAKWNRLFHKAVSIYPNNVRLIGRPDTTEIDSAKYELDIMSIKMSDFETIGGCPNDIWDPTLVDKILSNRINHNGIVQLMNSSIPLTMMKKKTYEHSKDNRMYTDYLYLDTYAQPYSGIHQTKYSNIHNHYDINPNVQIYDVDFTLQTTPLETFVLQPETSVYENVCVSYLHDIDISQSNIGIIRAMIVTIIEKSLQTSLSESDIHPNIIQVSLDTHLQNNIYKTLYFENKLQYILHNIHLLLTIIQTQLGPQHSFNGFMELCRVDYKYNPQSGFSIYIWEDYNYSPLYTFGESTLVHTNIFDRIYFERNKIDVLQFTHTIDHSDTIQAKIIEETKLEFVEYIHAYAVCYDKAKHTMKIFKIESEDTYTELKLDEDNIYALDIKVSDDETIQLKYINIYNVIYHSLKESIITEYKDKHGRTIFSEDMPKEYFDTDANYDGLEWGYETDIDTFERKNVFKKCYRLGVLYNDASMFVIEPKEQSEQASQGDGVSVENLKERIHELDTTTYCENNVRAKEQRKPIAMLYYKLLDISNYRPTNPTLIQPIEEGTDGTKEGTDITIEAKEGGEEAEGEMDTTSQSGGALHEKYFTISNMGLLQKGGGKKKSDLINIKKKIFYLLKGLPIKFIKKFQLDVEALYSITKYSYANKISKFIMKLDGIDHTSTILECMACVGGNSISFLDYFTKCIFVEKDSDKTSMLENNVNNYKKFSRKMTGEYSVINKDIIQVIRNMELYNIKNGCDVVFVDPPWGGVHYKYSQNIKFKIDDKTLAEFIDLLRHMTRYVIFKLPFNYDIKHLHKSLSKGCSIINVQDIKNTKGVIKMKIVFIEVTPSTSAVIDMNNKRSMDQRILGNTHIVTNDNQSSCMLPSQPDELDMGFLNLKDSQEDISVRPNTTKIITLKGFQPASPQPNIDHTVNISELNSRGGDEDHEDHEDHENHEDTSYVNEDIQSNIQPNTGRTIIIKKIH